MWNNIQSVIYNVGTSIPCRHMHIYLIVVFEWAVLLVPFVIRIFRYGYSSYNVRFSNINIQLKWTETMSIFMQSQSPMVSTHICSSNRVFG